MTDSHPDSSSAPDPSWDPAHEANPTMAYEVNPTMAYDAPPTIAYDAGPPDGDAPAWASAAPGYPDPAQPIGPGEWGAHTPNTAPLPVASRRRGPGWGSLVGVALAVALIAGLLGALVGSAFVSRNDAGPSSGPSPAGGTTTAAQPGLTARPSGSIANIAATATPSVVTLKVSGGGGSATGSGWAYDNSGHIVTNNHVVADAATSGSIVAVLADGSQAKATLVGRDTSYDLAVVKIDRNDVKPLPVGKSADVVVGDGVVAVGAPLGLSSTVTSGIVSALNRPVAAGRSGDQSFISALQTDAAINPGNSGGPLLDMSGRVIGVTSAIAQLPNSSGGASGSIGLGFAIPSDQVVRTVDQLIKTGKAVHPIIGVYLDEDYSGEGVRIDENPQNGEPGVNPGGPAAKAGLEPGDIILEFDGRPVTDPDELIVQIRAKAVGDSVKMKVRRGSETKDVTMVLEAAQN